MPGWVPFAGWMAFSHLDDGVGLTRAFTIAYKITDDSGELWSARFKRFKERDNDALAGAVIAMRAGIPKVMAGLELNAAKTVFIPALSSTPDYSRAKRLM
jgi:hypothetical protein